MELSKITILFPPELHERLIRQAEQQGIPLDELVQAACEAALQASSTDEVARANERADREAEKARVERQRADREAEHARNEAERADREAEKARREAKRADRESERADREKENAVDLRAEVERLRRQVGG